MPPEVVGSALRIWLNTNTPTIRVTAAVTILLNDTICEWRRVVVSGPLGPLGLAEPAGAL